MSETERCNLWLREKLEISKTDPNLLIQKRSELFNNCPHRWAHTLASFDPDKELANLESTHISQMKTQTQPFEVSQNTGNSINSKIKGGNTGFDGFQSQKATTSIRELRNQNNNSQLLVHNDERHKYLIRKRRRELGMGTNDMDKT